MFSLLALRRILLGVLILLRVGTILRRVLWRLAICLVWLLLPIRGWLAVLLGWHLLTILGLAVLLGWHLLTILGLAIGLALRSRGFARTKGAPTEARTTSITYT